MICGGLACLALFPGAASAAEGVDPDRQQGEDQWVPSLAIVSGVTIQQQHGYVDSESFVGGSPTSVPLRGPFEGSDIGVSPFVGGSLELMAPALPIATRPRFFLAGEILPTFASDRSVVVEGDPSCIRGPEAGAPCASDVTVFGARSFGEDSLNGEGSRTSAQVDTLVFGMNLGVAFPVQAGKRQLRIKPSIGWINYKIDASGIVVDGECSPPSQCTDIVTEFPPLPPFVTPGFLREVTLTGNGSQFFNGIGPGVDLEMDVGRYGPIGVSLLMGVRAYRVLGDRTITFDATQAFDDAVGTDVDTASWKVKVDPWMYRGNVGIRFLWFGSPD